EPHPLGFELEILGLRRLDEEQIVQVALAAAADDLNFEAKVLDAPRRLDLLDCQGRLRGEGNHVPSRTRPDLFALLAISSSNSSSAAACSSSALRARASSSATPAAFSAAISCLMRISPTSPMSRNGRTTSGSNWVPLQR